MTGAENSNTIPSMKPSQKATLRKPGKATQAPRKLQTTSISLRVSNTHLDALNQLELRDGVQRSAHIQRAIAEYLERRG